MNSKAMTIIIVSYNTKPILVKCLNSIYSTTDTLTRDVIVVDNDSRDGSVEMVKTNFPQAKVISNKLNNGYGAAANQGIGMSQGDYILLLNSDIELMTNSLSILKGFMDENPRVGVAGCTYLNSDGSIQYCGSLIPMRSLGIYLLSSILGPFMPKRMKYITDPNLLVSNREIAMVQGACMMIRRQAIEEVGLFDENLFMFGEESDLCLKMAKLGWKVFMVPGARVIHFGGASVNRVSGDMYVERRRADFYVQKKYYGILYAYSYRLLVVIRHIVLLLIGFAKEDGCVIQRDTKLLKWALFNKRTMTLSSN